MFDEKHNDGKETDLNVGWKQKPSDGHKARQGWSTQTGLQVFPLPRKRKLQMVSWICDNKDL